MMQSGTTSGGDLASERSLERSYLSFSKEAPFALCAL